MRRLSMIIPRRWQYALFTLCAAATVAAAPAPTYFDVSVGSHPHDVAALVGVQFEGERAPGGAHLVE